MPIYTHLHHLTLDSTHLWCKRERTEVEKKLKTNDYLIISTDEQTGGVGRHLRPWQSKKKDITFNLLLFDPVDPHASFHPKIGLFSQVIASVLTQKLREKGVPCYIKWPNDLVTEKGKLGGILTERLQSQQGAWLCIGIGINQQLPEQLLSLPQPTDAIANYLPPFENQSLILELAEALYERLTSLASFPFNSDDWLPYSYFKKGDRLTLERFLPLQPAPLLQGIFEKIDDEGRLHLMTQEGTMIKVTSGECTHVRKIDPYCEKGPFL